MDRSPRATGFADAAGWVGIAPAPAFASTGPHGHRARMRQRLLERGAAGLADYEILEMLLFLGIPRRDTKPLAKALLNQFGSLGAVLRAPAAAFPPEVTSACADVFDLVRQAYATLAAAEETSRPALSDWTLLAAYLERARGAPGTTRALFLDSRNRLVSDELADTETDGGLSALLRRALELQAGAALLACFRGRAARAAAAADIALLDCLRGMADPLSFTVHDVLIVGADGIWSVAARRAL